MLTKMTRNAKHRRHGYSMSIPLQYIKPRKTVCRMLRQTYSIIKSEHFTAEYKESMSACQIYGLKLHMKGTYMP